MFLVSPRWQVENKRYSTQQGEHLDQDVVVEFVFFLLLSFLLQLLLLRVTVEGFVESLSHLMLLLEGLLLDTVLVVGEAAGGKHSHPWLQLGFFAAAAVSDVELG